MQLVLQLTRDCNFACRYCYQRHRKGAGMPPAVAERAVEWALEQGHAHLGVDGGPDLVLEASSPTFFAPSSFDATRPFTLELALPAGEVTLGARLLVGVPAR